MPTKVIFGFHFLSFRVDFLMAAVDFWKKKKITSTLNYEKFFYFKKWHFITFLNSIYSSQYFKILPIGKRCFSMRNFFIIVVALDSIHCDQRRCLSVASVGWPAWKIQTLSSFTSYKNSTILWYKIFPLPRAIFNSDFKSKSLNSFIFLYKTSKYVFFNIWKLYRPNYMFFFSKMLPSLC